MQFDATVFFDLCDRDVWRLYRLLAASVDAGASLSMEWKPFAQEDAADRDALAVFAMVKDRHPERHGLFLQALLILSHRDRLALDWDTCESAGRAAAIDVGPIVAAVRDRGEGYDRVAQSTAEGRALGVVAVPTLHRHGPVLRIRTTPAVEVGDPLGRLDLIERMMGDDGLWELSKP